MKVAVTGAGGFVGRALVRRLLAAESPFAFDRLTVMDTRLPSGWSDPRLTQVEGDLRDPAIRARILEGGPDILFQLAALPSGATEQDPALAKAVNLDATLSLLEEAASAAARPPRVVYASSIAALGKPGGAVVDDDTPLRPTLTYGAYKAMVEFALADASRRGWIEGIGLRPAGIVARPLLRTGQRSAFLSDVFHAMRSGDPLIIPVRPTATSWFISISRCVDNLILAAQVPASSLPAWPALTMPALRVAIGDLVEALAQAVGRAPDNISYAPDEVLEAQFASYPPLLTPGAERLGLRNDGSVEGLVKAVLADIDQG